MNKPDLMVFDLDGTLIDSMRDLTVAINAMRSHYGLPEVSLDTAKTFVGKVLPALVVAPGVARLESQAPDVDGVTFIVPKGKTPAPPVGSVAHLRITAVKGYDFEGVPEE